MDLRSGKIVHKSLEKKQQAAMDQEPVVVEQAGDAPATPSQGTVDLNMLLEQMRVLMQQNSTQLTNQLKEEIQQNSTQLSTQIQETSNQLREEIREDVEKIQKSWEEKLQEMREEMSQKMDLQRIAVECKIENQEKEIQEVKQRLTNTEEEIEKTVKKEIEPLQEKIKRLEEKSPKEIQVVLHPSMLRTEPDIYFYGDKRVHPVIYLKEINEKIKEAGNEAQFKKIIRPTLRGKASEWYEFIQERCRDLDSFNDMFLEYFWGEIAQSKVREDLYTGKFDEARGTTREEYAIKKLNSARYLEPMMSDEDIIKYIARHFSEEIRDVIAIQGIREADKLLQYLRRLDDVKPVRRNGFFRGNKTGNPRQGGNEDRKWKENQENEKRREWPQQGENKNSTKENRYERRERRNSYSDHRKENNNKKNENEARRQDNKQENQQRRAYSHNVQQNQKNRIERETPKEEKKVNIGMKNEENQIQTVADIEYVPSRPDFM